MSRDSRSTAGVITTSPGAKPVEHPQEARAGRAARPSPSLDRCSGWCIPPPEAVKLAVEGLATGADAGIADEPLFEGVSVISYGNATPNVGCLVQVRRSGFWSAMPHMPFAIPVGIGSIGWKADLSKRVFWFGCFHRSGTHDPPQKRSFGAGSIPKLRMRRRRFRVRPHRSDIGRLCGPDHSFRPPP